MKARFVTILILLAFAFAGFAPGSVYAQAYSTSFTTSITYMNVGTGTATVEIKFYESASDTTPTTFSPADLAQNAGTSLFIGGLADTVVGASFSGSAVMSSNQPLLATLVQLPQGTTDVKNRPLSNAFSTGGSQSLIATVLKNTYDTTSIFSVQNVGTSSTTVTMNYYNTSATLVYSATQLIQPGASHQVDAGLVSDSDLGSSFNGSVVVNAASGGSIVSSVMELSTTGTNASAFEGVASGATTFYMPSGLCEAYGGTNTAYAVQNTNLTTSTSVTVLYSPGGATETKTIGPGAKQSFLACAATGMSTDWSGAAKITSATTSVIAIGKAYGLGLSTAFVGASSGTAKVALPYTRYASDADWAAGTRQRTYITIQNIGSSDLAAGAVTVKYLDKTGTVLATHSMPAIAVEAKQNSNAGAAGLTEFGEYPDGSFGGAAIIEGPSGSQLAVVGRVSTQVSAGSYASEDYNGMAVP